MSSMPPRQSADPPAFDHAAFTGCWINAPRFIFLPLEQYTFKGGIKVKVKKRTAVVL